MFGISYGIQILGYTLHEAAMWFGEKEIIRFCDRVSLQKKFSRKVHPCFMDLMQGEGCREKVQDEHPLYTSDDALWILPTHQMGGACANGTLH